MSTLGYEVRGVMNSKSDKAAALPKFSDTLTLSQSGRRGGGGGQDLRTLISENSLIRYNKGAEGYIASRWRSVGKSFLLFGKATPFHQRIRVQASLMPQSL